MAGLLQVPLFEDEILLSFLSRFALANGRDSPRRFCGDIGLDYEGICRGDPASIARLARTCSKDEAELRRKAVTLGLRHDVILFGERLSKMQVAKNFLRYCPACLADDDNDVTRMPGTRRYRRAHWLVNDYRVCLAHHCDIVLAGQYSNFDDINRHLGDVDVKAWVEEGRSRIEPTMTERFVAARLSGIRDRGPILDGIPLNAALYSGRLFGIAFTYGRSQLAETLSDDERATATANGLAILEGGEAPFFDALSKIASTAEISATGVSRYGRLSYTLFNRNIGDGFEPLRTLVRAHNTFETEANLRVLSAKPIETLTIRDIERSTGLSRHLVLKKLKASRLAQAGRVRLDNNVLSIFETPRSAIITFTRAREILGCSIDLFRQLAKIGLITPAKQEPPSRRGRSVYDEDAVAALRTKIVTNCLAEADNAMISIRQQARKSCGLQAGIIIEILEGRRQAAFQTAGGDLSDRIFVHGKPPKQRKPK